MMIAIRTHLNNKRGDVYEETKKQNIILGT